MSTNVVHFPQGTWSHFLFVKYKILFVLMSWGGGNAEAMHAILNCFI